MSSDFYGTGSSERARSVYSKIPLEIPEEGFELGPYNTHGLLNDPKRLGFLLARYKFVSKMFHGYKNVLEVGCQEGLGSMVVSGEVERLAATDFYRPHIESCLKRFEGLETNIEFRGHDILDGPVHESGGFDGAFSLDVLEHIDPQQENRFMENIIGSLSEHGVLVLGTPSTESQQWASPVSRAGHMNCKTGEELRQFCKRYFRQVFMFGMNDEVLHTGFLSMAHYLFALCVEPLSNGVG